MTPSSSPPTSTVIKLVLSKIKTPTQDSPGSSPVSAVARQPQPHWPSINPAPHPTSDFQACCEFLHFLMGQINTESSFTFQLLSCPRENPPWTPGWGSISPISYTRSIMYFPSLHFSELLFNIYSCNCLITGYFSLLGLDCELLKGDFQDVFLYLPCP